MKLLVIVLFALGSLSAQTSSSQSPTQPAPPAQAGPMHHPHHPGPMAGMRQQHMEAMKADLAKMRAKLDEMKANLAKVKDPAVKQQIQLDTDLWEMLAGHMEQMQKMMSDHPMGMMGGGMAGMHHQGMESCGCCQGMQGGMKCMQPPKPGTTDEPAPPADKQ